MSGSTGLIRGLSLDFAAAVVEGRERVGKERVRDWEEKVGADTMQGGAVVTTGAAAAVATDAVVVVVEVEVIAGDQSLVLRRRRYRSNILHAPLAGKYIHIAEPAAVRNLREEKGRKEKKKEEGDMMRNIIYTQLELYNFASPSFSFPFFFCCLNFFDNEILFKKKEEEKEIKKEKKE